MHHFFRVSSVLIAITLTFSALPEPCHAGFMFFADEDTDSIRRANLDGSDVITIVSGLVAPRGVAIDVMSSKLYWTDGHVVPRVIQRSNLDGSMIETLVTGPISGTFNTLALDLVNGKMYFADSILGNVKRANLDGSGLETIATGVDDPVGIAVDPLGGKVYWTGGAKTQRANLDGSGIEDILGFGARDLELDVANGKIYIGGGSQTIQRANLDGSGLELLISTVGFSQMGIDLVDGKIYWSDLTLDKIQRANLDGSGSEDVIVSGLSLPRDIAILNTAAVPEPSSYVLLILGGFAIACCYRRMYPQKSELETELTRKTKQAV